MKTYGEILREDHAGVGAAPGDEFTGDPRIRDLWEQSRYERHGLIRSMWGDPWAEASWPTRIGRVLSHGIFWIIGVPFMWAALVMMSFFATAIFLTFYNEKAPVEQYLGRARFIGLYLAAGLAGSAGALIQTQGVTVGASGAIFGILGAMVILEWQMTGRLGGNAMTLIVINLALSFALANVSIGGHIGGLIGGVLATLAFARWGRGHAAFGKLDVGGIAGLVAVAVVSVAIAYWQVRGLA